MTAVATVGDEPASRRQARCDRRDGLVFLALSVLFGAAGLALGQADARLVVVATALTVGSLAVAVAAVAHIRLHTRDDPDA